MSGWSRSEKISVAVLVVGLLSALGTWLAIPGVRSSVSSLLGTGEPPGTSPAGDSAVAGADPGSLSGGSTEISSPLLERDEWSLFDRFQSPGEVWALRDTSARSDLRVPGTGAGGLSTLTDTVAGGLVDRREGFRPEWFGTVSPTDWSTAKLVVRRDSANVEEAPEDPRDETSRRDSTRRSSVLLQPVGSTQLEYPDAACEVLSAGVLCTVTIKNPGSSAVPVVLTRSPGAGRNEGTSLALGSERSYPATGIELAGHRATGLSRIVRTTLPPGESRTAELAFANAAGPLADPTLRLVLVLGERRTEVRFR